MRRKLEEFMRGRYGIDQFGRFLNAVAIIVMIISLFVKYSWIYYLAFALIIYAYFRILSRDYGRRYAENQRFLDATAQIRNYFDKLLNNGRRADRSHRIFACPVCKQKIRVPRGKGKIVITCPKCKTEFVKRT